VLEHSRCSCISLLEDPRLRTKRSTQRRHGCSSPSTSPYRAVVARGKTRHRAEVDQPLEQWPPTAP
jgi:hypothetical protein